VSKRNAVASSQMQKNAERIQADPRMQTGPCARTVNRSRADDHGWDTLILFVIADQFILPKLAIAIGIMSADRIPLDRAGLIKNLTAGQVVVRVNRQRAYVHEPSEAWLVRNAFDQVSGRNYHVEKSPGERFLGGRSHMIDNRDALTGSLA